ncbi:MULTISPECIES: type II toxin-antitoxin system RelE family toxin [Mannheimia]|uniref:Type II toxin-antitoxin system RelE/ParE family toxin n=1 Tax=Mannheimia pernigra TaxID=111844 RepID=A0ABD7A7D3_9PAST|nr:MULTISPECIES: type II toxin-antitoxin system RelE/ParE family toxin [Mannheimia]QLB42016.1 type II toxin-antitoxin system RelE/ParE family toxin [Mannheimia pernigra]QLD32354.1 type II toxin-antitoxin system RelE/ParE family toxin [Mannheimia varigena]QTM00752.1 type II toxin-antitoxin system RelE/ParE family toxin [Mannheimia sp. ZY171111]
MNKITFTGKADKQLSKIDSRYIQAILDAIEALVLFPDVQLDIKKLKGYINRFRLRVGRYRVIFEVQDGEPKIIEIQTIAKRDEQTYTH